ncbi:MAG: hypothetical protein KAV82_04630 [Phycisphaerae bacterium]|nr:hypothetical protein [Phycisphaerae bacterium]
MLLWLSVVLATGAWLFTVELFCPSRPYAAVPLGVLAVLCVVVGVFRLAGACREAKGRGRLMVALVITLLTVAVTQWLFNVCYWRIVPYYQVSLGVEPLSWLLRLLGVQAVPDGDTISIQFLSSVMHIRPSFERWGLYPLGLMYAGCVALVAVLGRRRRLLMCVWLALLLVVYAGLRLVLLCLLSSGFEAPSFFWNPSITLLSLVPLGFLLSFAIPSLTVAPAPAGWGLGQPGRFGGGAVLVVVCAAAVVFSLNYELAGERKGGRILLNDLHSGFWEVSSGVFNEESYGELAIYNYVCLREWLGQFYDVRVNTDARITDDMLRDVDVLVLKTPVEAFWESEREAVLRFVEKGGGLWLHGDHTNLFGMSTYLNPLAVPFGFRFRFDDTFDLTTGRPSQYSAPCLAKHPVVAQIKDMTFQTTCTIEAPLLARPALTGYMLGSEFVDYGHTNFFGNIQVDPEDEFGAFLQAAAVSHKRGRVLAFSDSTIFSNFTMFLPGVPELALGSVDYLNRKEGRRGILVVVGVVGLLLGLLGGWLLAPWRHRLGFTALTGGLVIGVVVGGLTVNVLVAKAYPPLELRDVSRRAIMDTSICSFRLPSSLDYVVPDAERCFDAFYLNISRAGLQPWMGDGLGSDVPAGTVRVFLLPTHRPEPADLVELRSFVESGGRVMVLESSVFASKATRMLLESFDMRVTSEPGAAGTMGITGAERLTIPAERIPRTPGTIKVYAKRIGAGKVMCVIGAESLSRKLMGQVYKNPNILEREWYRLQCHLFHRLLDRTKDADEPK